MLTFWKFDYSFWILFGGEWVWTTPVVLRNYSQFCTKRRQRIVPEVDYMVSVIEPMWITWKTNTLTLEEPFRPLLFASFFCFVLFLFVSVHQCDVQSLHLGLYSRISLDDFGGPYVMSKMESGSATYKEHDLPAVLSLSLMILNSLYSLQHSTSLHVLYPVWVYGAKLFHDLL